MFAMYTGSVSFTLNTITWFLPRHIDPLIYSGQFKLLEVHMGVDGQRLEPPEIAARRYSLTVNDVYIIVEIPIGAVGGYFKVSSTTNYLFNLYFFLLWMLKPSLHGLTRYRLL